MASDRRRSPAPEIALFVEEAGGDWHTSRLIAALETRGAKVTFTTLSRCAFDTGIPTGLAIPGYNGQLPDGVFVRSVSKGSLEQITLRLGILHALAASGVRVWNSAPVIERCVDKSTATFLFQRAGLPTPTTRTAEGRAAAQTHAAGNTPLVAKPLFGSQGRGIQRVTNPSELPASEDVGNVYYLQQYIGPTTVDKFEDWRVLVSAGHAVAAMRRQGKGWVTNVFQGSKPKASLLDATMTNLAVRAAAAVGADYAGVDLIRDSNGELMVLEINSNPAWKGLQSVTEVDIASHLADDFLAAVARQKQST